MGFKRFSKISKKKSIREDFLTKAKWSLDYNSSFIKHTSLVHMLGEYHAETGLSFCLS